VWGNAAEFGGSQQPQEIIEPKKDTPKVNVWCGMKKDRIIGLFFFQEATVTSHSYLNMLEHSATVPSRRTEPTFWTHSPSVLKLTFSEQVDWKRRFPSMTYKIIRPKIRGIFPLALREEYRLSG
jgi:hypothetical protein